MDPDEILVLVGGLAISGVAGVNWFSRLASAGAPYSTVKPIVRLTLALLPIASAGASRSPEPRPGMLESGLDQRPRR